MTYPTTTTNSPTARQDAEALLRAAAGRGPVAGLPYAGWVTPPEAHALLVSGLARIVDVRTRPEWEFVGHVEGATLVEWRPYGAAAPDPLFTDRLAALFTRDEPLLFLCRSAVRSHNAAAAASAAGFRLAFNILEGFEGDKDEHGRRGRLGGWRKAGLPWIQG